MHKILKTLSISLLTFSVLANQAVAARTCTIIDSDLNEINVGSQSKYACKQIARSIGGTWCSIRSAGTGYNQSCGR